jgi:hypothetical protein
MNGVADKRETQNVSVLCFLCTVDYTGTSHTVVALSLALERESNLSSYKQSL